MEILKGLAAKIKTSPNLHDLLRNLVAFEAAVKDDDRVDHTHIGIDSLLCAHGVDLAQLPTFGGTEPRHTEGLWSYDEDRVLVGEGPFRDWEIFDRDDESQSWRA